MGPKVLPMRRIRSLSIVLDQNKLPLLRPRRPSCSKRSAKERLPRQTLHQTPPILAGEVAPAGEWLYL